ncbi:MAG: FMN-binding protein [Ruminococcus sp.]|nr:FMN-binding protein [Ruminococcus sp.]
MREKIVPPLVLLLICICVSGLLVLANAATKDKIRAAQEEKLKQSLVDVFGEADYQTLEQTYEGVTQVIRDDKNRVIFDITVDGYAKDGLQLLIGIDESGAVCGISIVSIGETPGLGTKVQGDAFLEQFNGINSAAFTVDTITGATYSSNGMKKAVETVMKTYLENKEAILS